MENVDKYIKDWFIDLDINKIPPSFFVIRKTLIEAVKELKPKLKGSVIDLGCGVMPYKDFLYTSSIDSYIGIDLHEPTSYQNIVKPDLYWDGVNIPLKDSSCDYVIATEFLEHYHETSHILLEIKRVLKKNGVFFFTVPALWPIHEAPNDHHRFTPFALKQHFQKAGYSNWEIKPLGGLHVSVSLILSLWFEKIQPSNKKIIINFFFKRVIKFLLKKDRRINSFNNGQLYSGLYGFVTK